METARTARPSPDDAATANPDIAAFWLFSGLKLRAIEDAAMPYRNRMARRPLFVFDAPASEGQRLTACYWASPFATFVNHRHRLSRELVLRSRSRRQKATA